MNQVESSLMRSALILVTSLFLSLSLCAVTVGMTIDVATWSAVGNSFWRCVLLTVLIVAGEVLCRAVRQTTMASAIQQRLSLGASGKITLIGDFACTVTPSRLGGDPARLYGLVREHISWGHASVLLAGEFVTNIVVLVSVLIVVAFWGDHGATDNATPMSLFPTLWPIALALCSFTIGGYVVFRYASAIERWCRY
ncbi:MAG: flippase-like domain-containing protein, partial [Candidatus Latescibacteria bacterium]|nr:flippase-like domain-containing protein [Candidatus Latescibacterota bacterium]